MPVQSTIGLTDPYLSLGLTAGTDFTTNFPFINLMLTARDPFSTYENGAFFSDYLDAQGWAHTVPDSGPIVYNFDWGGFTALDDDGAYLYPELVANQSGTYVLHYKGEGNIEVRAIDATYRDDDGDGRIEFTVAPSEPTDPGGAPYFGFDIVITATGDGSDFNPADPSHIRDIALFHEDHEDLYEAGAIFNPEWLEVVSDFRQVRFMDWSQVNDSTKTTLDEFQSVDSASWADSVPLEIQVQLANQIGADPWFNIPHLLSPEDTRAFVEYVRDNLDPNLVATFEYSNELWNPIFDQHQYVQQQAVTWFGEDAYLRDAETGQFVLDGSGAPLVSNYAVLNAQMVLATQTAVIVQEVYAETPDLLYNNTIGISIGLGGSQEVMDQYSFAPMWAEASSGGTLPNYVAPHSVFDTVAATSYFGAGLLSEDFDVFLPVLEAYVADPSFDIDAWLLSYVMGTNSDFADPVTGDVSIVGSVPWLLATLEDVAASVSGLHPSGVELDLGLTLYEGGQHLIHETPNLREPATDADGNPILDASGAAVFTEIALFDEIQQVLLDFVRGDLITQAYEAVSEGWTAIGDGAFVQYGDVKLPGPSGFFDMLAHLDDSTPLSEALLTMNATTAVQWEDRGGTQFQQGLQPDLDGAEVYPGLADLTGDDLIEGTAAEDLLFGGAGQDTLNGYDEVDQGQSGDTLAGGAGDDVLNAGAGADHLYGGTGNDLMTGGAGSDSFRLGALQGADTITDYDPALDQLLFDGDPLPNLSALPIGLSLSVTGTGTVITSADGASVLLEGYFHGDDTGPGPGLVDSYSLDGPDAQVFVVDTTTGAVSYQGWFSPDFDDPWDANEDNIYEVSVIGLSADGGQVSRSDLELVVAADGADWRDAGTDSGPDDGGGGDTSFALEGPDAQLFVIDPATGDISYQDWFTPSFDDPWDRDEDNTYQVTRVGTNPDGSEANRDDLELVVTADAATWQGDDGGGGGDTGGGGGPVDGTASYTLAGPDAFLFVVDSSTGEVSTQGWFTPSFDDAWDADENHVYDVSVVGLAAGGSETSRTDLQMVVSAEGITWQNAPLGEPDGSDLMEALATVDAAEESFDTGSEAEVETPDEMMV